MPTNDIFYDTALFIICTTMMYSNDTVIDQCAFKQPVYSTSKRDTQTHNMMGS